METLVLSSSRRRRPQLRRSIRLWMTGSIAVVMAALLPLRGMAEVETTETQRLLRHSRHGVHETVQRLEAAARQQGMAVLALLSDTAQPVLVLESTVGGTLVVMDESTDRVHVPFSLRVVEAADGGSNVLMSPIDPDAAAWREVPDRVAEDLARLPAMVEQAVA